MNEYRSFLSLKLDPFDDYSLKPEERELLFNASETVRTLSKTCFSICIGQEMDFASA